MKKFLYLLIAFFLIQNAYSQRFTVKGVIADTSKTPLPFITVTLLKPADSTLVHFASTEEDGSFLFKNIEAIPYVLKVSYVGFQAYIQSIDSKTDLDLGMIQLKATVLAEVILKGEREPITIKKDTIEYNAGSFKVRPNSSVEELLKKLPGVEIDADGNVKVQGQNVQKILVNGKEFFGNDPKMATKNLPADAVDKVQVFDQKTDQAVFSGIDDGQKTKTINLETKDKNKQMAFGKVMGGYGTDNRYEGKANFNTFKNKNQFSLIGMGNNVNQSGFSFSDYFEFTGGGNGMGRGGGGMRSMTFDGEGASSLPLSGGGFGGAGNFGFLRNLSGGANFNRQLGKNLELNGSYFLNNANNSINKIQYSENFLPNTIYTTNQNNDQRAINTSHRLNLTLDYKIDSLNSLKLTTSGSVADNKATVNTFVRSLLNGNTLQNENKRDNYNESLGLTYNVNLLFRHRFKKKGRTFSTTLGTTSNDQTQEGNLQSTNSFFVPNPLTFALNQQNEQRSYAQTYSVKSSYTEPVGKKMYLEINHLYQNNQNEVKREVFDMIGEQREVNTLLTNDFDNTFQFNRIGASYRITRKKLNMTLGLNGQFSDLKGKMSNQSDISRKFENVLPIASIGYAFAQTKNFNFDYSTNVREPSIQQLQPVINNTDPLNISKGNPDLRPQYTHRANANYVQFNPTNFTNLFASVNVNYSTNSIVNAQTIEQNLVRTTQPVNTKGTFNIGTYTNYGMRIQKLKSRFNVGTNITYNRSINLLNNQESYIHQEIVGGNIRYEFNIEEIWDISITANLSHQKTSYDFNEAQNQRFLNETYGVSTNLNFTPRFWFSSNLNYMIYKGLTSDFYQELPMLNASLSALVLKNGKGELKLALVNALNQNTGVTQTANANSLQQETINSLGRYLMLSFTYSLNKLSNPASGKNNMRRMMFGGMN